MSNQPFKPEDILWQWTPDRPVKHTSMFVDGYFCVRDGDAHLRMWYLSGGRYYKDYCIPAWGVELLHQRDEQVKRIAELEGKLQRWVGDIMERREYATCWHNDDGDCGNWPTCNPHCSLREMMDHVGITPQEDGGLDKQALAGPGGAVGERPEEGQKGA